MLKIKIILLSLFYISSSLFVASAQQAASSSYAVLTATVNIFHATTTQEDGKVIVSFDLNNEKGVQPGVKYGILLVKEENKRQTVVDEYVYNDIVVLGENVTIHKSVVYIPPKELDGTYKVFVSSKNSNGFPFGTMPAGTIFLKKSVDLPISIDQSSCYLTVEGDTKKIKYSPLIGVDINADETLISNCIVENKASTSITVIPSFLTRSRSSFGEIATTTGGDTQQISLSPKEKKEVQTRLPKSKISQSYHLVFGYGDMSNTVIYHYVIQGVSGTIQNLILDKTFYQEGDTANISFIWTKSASNFAESRLGTTTSLTNPSFSITLFDKNGNVCSKPFIKTLTHESVLVSTHIPIIKDCVSPKADVILRDEKVGTLSSITLTTENKNIQDEERSLRGMIPYLVVALVCVIIIFILLQKRKKNSSSVIVVTGFLLFLSISSNNVHAATFSVTTPDGSRSVDFTVGLDSNSYTAGGMISISGSAWATGCGNACSPGGTCRQALLQTQTVVGTIDILNQNISGYSGVSNTVNAIAPLSGGGYNILVYGTPWTSIGLSYAAGGNFGQANLPFTVTVPPTVNINFSFLDKVKALFASVSTVFADTVFAMTK